MAPTRVLRRNEPGPLGPGRVSISLLGAYLFGGTSLRLARHSQRWPRLRGSGLPGPRRSAHTRPLGAFPLVEVCLEWKLPAISATKFSNAVNLPPRAGGMPMRLTISPGSNFGSAWRIVGAIWPAALHSSNKFPTSTRLGERASASGRATGDAVVFPSHGSHAATY